MPETRSHRGFSLIELVIVVLIIGIISAIAIPRISRGSGNAADAALSGNLAVLRNAIELYGTEHNGDFPKIDATDTFEKQLTLFTDAKGNTSETKTGDYVYGPYLRKVPPLPVGGNDYKGKTTVADATAGVPGTTKNAGWHYNATTGEIKANVPDTEVDRNSVKYNSY
ncbi:MAG: prepilin-type N-terminal cleavage/methylation domain-containing protein [Bacillota bacterium]